MQALMGKRREFSLINSNYSLVYSRYSHKILWLEVSPTNKSSKVIAGYYLEAVQNFGEL